MLKLVEHGKSYITLGPDVLMSFVLHDARLHKYHC